LSSLLSTGAPLSTYSNPQLDRLLDDARYELDSAKRQAMYFKALAIVKEEAPWLFLFQYQDVYATTKRLEWHARGDEIIFCEDMKVS
jgi:peptide/nickel transport system substrate-binding protein